MANNITENRTNTIINPVDEATLTNSANAYMTALAPYVQTLTDGERKSLFSVAEENLVFVNLAREQGQTLGNLIPGVLSNMVTNLGTDLDFYMQLRTINETFVAQLQQQVEDTKRVAAHEAYVGALAIYKLIEALASVGTPGAQAAYEVLKVRFENQGGGAPGQPTP